VAETERTALNTVGTDTKLETARRISPVIVAHVIADILLGATMFAFALWSIVVLPARERAAA
jgi:hypothetical protein